MGDGISDAYRDERLEREKIRKMLPHVHFKDLEDEYLKRKMGIDYNDIISIYEKYQNEISKFNKKYPNSGKTFPA